MRQLMKYSLLSLILFLSGCYGIQESYDYKAENVDPHLNMSVWEFIESRPDTLSLQKEAIEYVSETYPEIKEYYTQTDKKYTYLLMRNDAFTRSNAPLGLFAKMGVKSVRQMDVRTLRNILLYSIIEGCYHAIDVSGGLGFDPVNVINLWKPSPPEVTFNDVEMTLCMEEDRLTTFGALILNKNVPNRLEVAAVNCNYLATNGAVHIFNYQYFYE